MSRTTATRTIQAPLDLVFDTVANIENFRQVVPDILKVEFLSETKLGVGARFRETRRMGKREASTTLEVTEYVPNERIRLVSDQGGTIWDSVFTTRALSPNEVELTLTMDANAYRLLAKLFNPLIKGMVQKALEKDMDAVKVWCEAKGATS